MPEHPEGLFQGLHIYFSDDTSQTVDFRPFILAHPHPQYNRYIAPKNFKKFSIEHGNVGHLDILGDEMS